MCKGLKIAATTSFLFLFAISSAAYGVHYQAVWTGANGSGLWSDAGNWDIAAVPVNGTNTFDVVIPGGFNIYFDIDGSVDITDLEIAAGSALHINPGHSLTVLDDSLITGTLAADGVSTVFISETNGAALGDGGVIKATGGAFAKSQASSYSSKTINEHRTLFSADGVDTRIDLSGLQTLDCAFTTGYRTHTIEAINSGYIDFSSVGAIIGPTNWSSLLNFQINSSGYINLSNLTDILGGYVRFDIDVPGYMLASLLSAKTTVFDISESSGLYVPNLNTMNGCSVYIADNTEFNAPKLTSFIGSAVSLTPLKTFTTAAMTNTDGSRFILTEGAQFGTAWGDIIATGYSATELNNNYTLFSASGTGTILDLSSYEVLNDDFTAGYRTHTVQVFDNGFIDLSSVSTLFGVSDWSSLTKFTLNSGGNIDLSALTEIPSGYVHFDVNIPSYTLPLLASATTTKFDASAVSTIELPALTALASSTLQIEDGGKINAPNLTSVPGCVISLTPLRTLVTGPLNHLDNAQIHISEGAEFGSFYGNVTATGYSATGLNNNYTVFSVAGTGSVLDLSSLTAINDRFTAGYRTHTYQASDGGLLDLSAVEFIAAADSWSSSTLFNIQSGGDIDLGSLVQIPSGYARFNVDIPSYTLPLLEYAANVTFDASAVSTIELPALAAGSGSVFTIEDGGTINAPQLVSLTYGNINLSPLKTLVTGSITNIDNTVISINDGAQFGTAYGNISAPSYTATGLNNNYTVMSVAGSGSVLDLSSVESINDAFTSGYRSHTYSASDGAVLDLSAAVSFAGASPSSSRSHINSASGAEIIFGNGFTVNNYTTLTATAASMTVGGFLNINSPAAVHLLEGAVLKLGGDFIYNTTDENAVNFDAGVLEMAGAGTLKLEVGGEDLGIGGATAGNFGIAQLQVGSYSQPATVMLVDLIDNGNRSGGQEALYLYGSGGLSGLRIRPGSKLIIGDVNLYVNTGDELIHINSLFTPGRKWIAYDEGAITLTEYECSLLADITGDCVVNLDDFSLMAGEWLQSVK
ncbi:hypothetical protein SMSP2_02938 [Limihaloglobus sulfuriphilus]|uniref:Uncharacterized protein n=1 Tax=Limihaloglobus sulfuriphilus TaxID=1851148 RepID=A0A1Q2MIZ1_9BACT|nr:hypothetical protein [Limihaloglobus sulfuriphilus]AQQ72548.1 hypothetical protein SMSP2_02938 [Limihaloglobus sulfuriphilus]